MTASEPLARELEKFLEGSIESYEQLAVLLLLRRERDRDWSLGEVADALAIPAGLVQSAAASLCERQLLRVAQDDSPPPYRYAVSGTSDALVERLGLEFSQNPARLMRLLSAHAIERVRTSAIRAFADSFVLRKKDPDRG
jgi:hypothetical protein